MTSGFIWSGACSTVVTGLTPNSTYYFQAYAYGKYGEILSFNTLSSGVTPTPTIQPPVTPTPPPTGSVKVQFYNQSTAATTNQLYLNIKVVNTGSSSICLSNVKIRYYYTKDGVQTQNFYCDYTPVGSSNVTSAFVTVSPVKTVADTYLEIGFLSGAGSLAAGGGSTTIQARVAKSDWSNYTQTNDYSFNDTATAAVDWTKVTGDMSGLLLC